MVRPTHRKSPAMSSTPPRIEMYHSASCGYCMMARRLLADKGVPVKLIAVDGDAKARADMEQRSGRRTVPQIFIGERHLGGFEEIAALDHKGELDPLLADPTRSA
jgi:glutaredoxin 3